MERLFNNADSFAMAFDDAWKKLLSDQNFKDLAQDKKISLIFESHIENHPFLIENPDQALQVANFRIRLLGLN